MAWKKQNKFSRGKKITSKIVSTDSNELLFQKFMEDWEASRDRHPGQQQVLDAVFVENLQYVFYRAGRKGAKTTTAIDIAWRMAHKIPKSVGYLCYPTIAQGIEVVWEERRLQTCDRKDDFMFDKYVEKTDDSKHIIWFANGSFIKLIGTWTEKKGRGTQPDYLILDEFQDCNADYIEAMDSNLAAKNSPCIIMGTPPKKRNHYEEWLERVGTNPRGKVFHFTSYDNVRLPHLKEWLDNKKIELVKAGKEDVWLREYMAQLCYSSSDRMLPDAKFLEKDEITQKMLPFHYNERIPIVAVSIHPGYFCAILCVLNRGKNVFVMDHLVINQIWNRSFSEIHPELKEKIKDLQDLCGKKIRNIVWDDSNSFCDIVNGFTKCRKDIKWQERGIPLLREMMVKDKIYFCNEIADFGVECQNFLIDETEKEVQKNYPHICTLAVTVNEFFSPDKIQIVPLNDFDKYQAFRDMGIPYAAKRKVNRFFKI